MPHPAPSAPGVDGPCASLLGLLLLIAVSCARPAGSEGDPPTADGSPVFRWQMLTKDPRRQAEFYSGLLGWRIEVNDDGPSPVDTRSRGGLPGELWPSPPTGHSFVQLFIAVDDVRHKVGLAESLGAELVVAPQETEDGVLAVLRDPEGIPFVLADR